MNKVAHYNGFVGRCQQYGLTKQAADMLYKQGFFGLTKKQAPNNPSNYQSNGWAPRTALPPSATPWANGSEETSIPSASLRPNLIIQKGKATPIPYGISPNDIASEYSHLFEGMTPYQRMYSRANPNYAGWFNAHTKSLKNVLSKYPEINKADPSDIPDFRNQPEILADMSKTYHDSMYNLTNGTPRVVAPATPGTSRGRSYDF